MTRVAIEWAPKPRQEYLGDNTAFDAFVEYEVTGGGLGFIGVETKLTEPFSQTHYDRPSYRRWMNPGGPWRPDAADRVDAVVHNQLWRDHLLAVAMLQRAGSPYREGRLALVRHPLDAECAEVVAGYRELLRDASTFQDLPLDTLVASWKAVTGADAWLDAFALRYLDLARSEAAWEKR